MNKDTILAILTVIIWLLVVIMYYLVIDLRHERKKSNHYCEIICNHLKRLLKIPL
jgi:L-asparagine transporter-like permease